MQKVSIFKNFSDVSENLLLEEVIRHIREGRCRREVEDLRLLLNEGKKKEYDQEKKKLPAFTPCGTFAKVRKSDNILVYSKCIILDIDKLSREQLGELKHKIQNNEYTYAVFVSPGGYGLKVLVRVNTEKNNHLNAFNRVKEYFERQFGIVVDPSGKDISRLCFYSWDNDVVLNPHSSIFWVDLRTDIETDIQRVVEQIELQHLDITGDYQGWLDIGFALVNGLGENGRQYYHRVSQFYHDYDQQKCDAQYTNCLKSGGSGITIRTFFHIAKNKGINIKRTCYYVRKKDNRSTVISTENEKQEKKQVNGNKFHLAMKYIEENYDLRYNIISAEFEYKPRGEKEYHSMNENDIFINMQLNGVGLSLNNLLALLKSDYVKKYNPFVEYFKTLPEWDKKTDFILNLASYVKVNETDRKRFDIHFKKWLVRTVRCALIDTYFNKQALILVQDKQNSGKSTFCRFLCPPALKNYIAENISIDKDSRILLTTNMIINLDELSTLSKVEINALKSMFSKDKINDRLPYERKNSIIPRRASFIGSTNQTEFLSDETGSVRWLCFQIEGIDWSYKTKVNIDKVYSQAYYLHLSRWNSDLTNEEISENEEINRQFQIKTTEQELIEKYLEPGDQKDNDNFMTATDILMYLVDITENKIRMNTNNIGKALKMLEFSKVKEGKDRHIGYYIKYKK